MAKADVSLSELGLHAQENVQLQIDGVRYITCFQGATEGRWLFFDLPKMNGGIVSLVKQQTISVRYMMSGAIYGFKTSVSSVYYSPYQIFVAAYPWNVEKRNLRRSFRIKTFIPVNVAPHG